MTSKNGIVLEQGVRPPVPEASPWIGDILGAAAWAWDKFMVRADERAGKIYGLRPDLPTVVVMVDGLGYNLLMDRLGYARTLRGIGTEPTIAQTCSPSTTAAALTSFATGKLPGATQMVGYSVHFEGAPMNLLNFRPGVDVAAWQKERTYFTDFAGAGVETTLATKPKFAGSGLTQAAFRGTRFIGKDSLAERFTVAREVLAKGAPLVYVYWADIDHVGHKHGPDSSVWANALEDFDSELGRFLRDLKTDANVIVTADHGMITVGERFDIAQIPLLGEGVKTIAGEGRAVHVHAEPGQADEVGRRWEEFFGDGAWIFPKAVAANIIGDGPGLELIGDVLVMPKETAVVVDSRVQSPSAIAMKGVHGSLTPDEMQIPVWLVN